MKRYVTSVEVEAVHWIGTDSSYQEIVELLSHTSERKISPFSPSLKTLFIEIDKKYSLTLSIGGYLIRGVTGQYFVMSEEEFNKYYKPIELEKKESNKEIERKFLIEDKADIPTNILLFNSSKRYEQYYILSDPEIRIRSIDNEEFKFTIKSDVFLTREEFEVDIPEEIFNILKGKYVGCIKKTRYFINGFELDIYDDFEFATVEVEFESEEEANAFVPPEWFGKDITDNKHFKNKNLAMCHKD